MCPLFDYDGGNGLPPYLQVISYARASLIGSKVILRREPVALA